MCSTLVDSLQCYMDDLVDSFENFVKKSLIIMTLAIGAIIAMFVYALRIITERQLNTLPSSPQDTPNRSQALAENINSEPKSDHNVTAENCLDKDFTNSSYVLQYSKSLPSASTIGANASPFTCHVPSFDERVLRNIGFTNCSKSCNSSNETLFHDSSKPRLTIPSRTTDAKERYYNHSRTASPIHQYSNHTTSPNNIRWIVNMATRYLETAYIAMSGYYLAIVTVFVVVLLSYVIPDLSQKIHATNDLNNMKKVLTIMSEEVVRAEAACCTAADQVCQLHCSMQDDATETAGALEDHSVCTSHYMRTTQSEPVQVKKKIGFFRRIFLPARNASYKEFTIMSYLYTNSFDAKTEND